MFIIFGWGFTTTHVFGAVFPLLCPNCHNEEFWVLRRVRRWFTLFFIPVFPYESTHVLTCPICGVGREMSGVELKRAKMFAETNADYQAGALREVEYETRLGAIGEASDGQVRKGLAFVASVPVSPSVTVEPLVMQSPRRSTPVVPASAIPPAPVAPPAPSLTDSGASPQNAVYCVGCGTQFEGYADAFCPRCGTARSQESAIS